MARELRVAARTSIVFRAKTIKVCPRPWPRSRPRLGHIGAGRIPRNRRGRTPKRRFLLLPGFRVAPYPGRAVAVEGGHVTQPWCGVADMLRFLTGCTSSASSNTRTRNRWSMRCYIVPRPCTWFRFHKSRRRSCFRSCRGRNTCCQHRTAIRCSHRRACRRSPSTCSLLAASSRPQRELANKNRSDIGSPSCTDTLLRHSCMLPLLAVNRHSPARAMSSMAWRRCTHCW